MPLNDRDRKALKIGGIVAAVLVLGLLALGQLGKGGGSALPPLSVGPSVSGGPTGVTGVPSTGPSGSVPPSQSAGPVPSPIFSGRDPFSLPPQFPQPGGTSGGTGPVPTGPVPTGSTGGTTGPGPTGSTGGTTGPGPTGPTLPPTNGSSTTIGGHEVVLIDTYTANGVQHASVSVDGTVYHPAEGDTFAGGNFQLRDVAGDCATFLFGDQSFTLCFVPSK
jgi:hypothetical protein